METLARGDGAEDLAVHFEGGAGFEKGGPLDGVDGHADVLDFGEEDVVFDVEDAGGFVGTFEEAADAAEVPAFAVGHGGDRFAEEEGRRRF